MVYGITDLTLEQRYKRYTQTDWETNKQASKQASQQANKQTENIKALSPQAKYIDWGSLWSEKLLQIFTGMGFAACSAHRTPTTVNLEFPNRSRKVFLQIAPQLSSKVWMDPVQDLLLLRKHCRAWKRTRDLWNSSLEVWPLDHSGGPSASYRFTKVMRILRRIESEIIERLKRQEKRRYQGGKA
jgi:hypothetical protein